MESNDPKITVIMPCYNRAIMVKKAIESILKQTFTNFEFIIVDDKSNEETKKLLNQFSFKDKRIKLYSNISNRGPTYSFNKGLYYAKAVFIARMDSDDISHPERLKKQLEFLISNPTTFVIGTAVNTIDKENKITNTLYFKKNRAEINEALKYSNPLVNSSYMANTNVLKKKNLYLNKIFYPADDYYSWYKLIYNKQLISNIDDVLLDYRVHESESFLNSQMQGLKTLFIQKLFILNKFNYFFFPKISNLNTLTNIKASLENFPSFARPTRIEMFYYENTLIKKIDFKNEFFLKLVLYIFSIKNFNDLKLYILYLFRFLKYYIKLNKHD